VRGPHEGESTDAGHRDGAVCSREEGSVMELDRRDCVVQLYRGVNQKWEESVNKEKPFNIICPLANGDATNGWTIRAG
jgi:hypothetical protein